MDDLTGGRDSKEVRKEMDERLKLNLEDIKKLYKKNELFVNLYEQKDFDIRYCESFQDIGMETVYPKIKLLDDKIIGCYKIEKYIRKGYFLGSKFYSTKCMDIAFLGKLDKKCKMKGIQERHREFIHYEQLWNSIFDFNSQIDITDLNFIEKCVLIYKQQMFTTMHTGVRIANVIKMIIPTLVKRKFMDHKGVETFPFRTDEEQKEF